MAPTLRARIAGILAISLLMLSAPGALATGTLGPDAKIRRGFDLAYTGVGITSLDGSGQAVTNSGVVGQKLTFFIKIENHGPDAQDSFTVKRSGFFHEGYRVRYYDAANNDVTGRVNKGTFTTPLVLDGGTYEMRATVKVRSLATACSSVTRLITVTSVATSYQDAVKFTAELDASC